MSPIVEPRGIGSSDGIASGLILPRRSGDSFTKLLMHMDGADSGTTFTDVLGHTLTVSNAQTKTGAKQFGTASGYFDGTSACIRMEDSLDWKLGTEDFTIDLWVNPTTGGHGGAWARIFVTDMYPNVGGIGLVMRDVENPGRVSVIQTEGPELIISDGTLTNGAWTHLAVVRKSGTIMLFVNGTKQTTTYATALPITTTGLAFGANPENSAEWYKGYIDEVRISKGIARWDSNFSVPTSPYADLAALPPVAYDKYTTLLLHADGTNGSTTFTDSSYRARVIAAQGAAQISATQSKFGGSSALFATPQSVYATASASHTLGTGDFTIDFWAYLTDSVPSQFFCGQYVNGTNIFTIGQNNGQIEFSYIVGGSTKAYYYKAATFGGGNWHHLAFVRSGTNFYMFYDGNNVNATVGTAIGTNSLSYLAAPFCVGHYRNDAGAYGTSGYIDEFRISKGIARWTANFTPPTAAY